MSQAKNFAGLWDATLRPWLAADAVTLSRQQCRDTRRSVLFCDLVDSTALASQLDPEELREVVRAYQDTCAKVIARFEGHIAQYLGDGLLVYFGYPLAHEDDAQRAVRAGLGMIEALGQLIPAWGRSGGCTWPCAWGSIPGWWWWATVGEGRARGTAGPRRDPQPGGPPARHRRAQYPGDQCGDLSAPRGFFACQPLGTPPLKGLAQPLAVYRVLYESMARSRLEAASSTGWTPLVGREQEIGVLLERWAQVKDGLGQVVLLSGEAGIGKSRLVQVLTDQVAAEPQAWLTPCQCSPYHQHTALYPLIDLLERVACASTGRSLPSRRWANWRGSWCSMACHWRRPVPLFAALLSLPLPADYAPLTVSPEQQKQQTLHALLTILLRIAAQQPVLFVMEDLHWVDPSTLELLSLLVDQGPTARILALFTFRPDFSPPWTGRAHLTQLTVNRLPRRQAVEVIRQVAHGKVLPPEVVEQIVAKTDGVPLFVEELTKMVLESGPAPGAGRALCADRAPAPAGHSRHPARLADGAAGSPGGGEGPGPTRGDPGARVFLRAAARRRPVGGGDRAPGTAPVGGSGVPVPAGGAAAGHLHVQACAHPGRGVSVVVAEHPPAVPSAHCPGVGGPVPGDRRDATRAGRPALHRGGLRRAGGGLLAAGGPTRQRPLGPSGSHQPLTTGIELLKTLPETPAHTQHALTLHIALGAALQMAKGLAAPEVEHAYTQAHALCQQVGETPELVPVLFGLWRFYVGRSQLHTARELGDTLLRLAQRAHDPALAVLAHYALGLTWLLPGRVACCPPAPGGRHRTLHARPAPCAGVPHRPRSGCCLPSLCRADPLVTGVPGASPGQPPRGPGVGARAVASL